MEQDMRTRTHPRKNLGQRNMRLRKERPSSRKISLYLYKMTFPNVRWREIWADTWQAPAEKNKYLRPHSSDCKTRFTQVTHQRGPLKILKKSHNNNFFFFFEVRLLRTDSHRFVSLISLFHQMKGMPWIFTPSPLPWTTDFFKKFPTNAGPTLGPTLAPGIGCYPRGWDSFHSDVIKLLSQNSEVLRILIYTRLKINKK